MPGEEKSFYGLDFGFDPHPAGMVKCESWEHDHFVDEVIYERGLVTSDIIRRFGHVGVGRGDAIYCDSAESDRIEEIKRAGYQARKSIKHVEAGIQYVKSKRINITIRSKNLIKEIKKYKRPQDSNLNVLPGVIKKKDDLMDAMRYALYTHFLKGVNPGTTDLTSARAKKTFLEKR